jgi:hypothetical protein
MYFQLILDLSGCNSTISKEQLQVGFRILYSGFFFSPFIILGSAHQQPNWTSLSPNFISVGSFWESLLFLKTWGYLTTTEEMGDKISWAAVELALSLSLKLRDTHEWEERENNSESSPFPSQKPSSFPKNHITKNFFLILRML